MTSYYKGISSDESSDYASEEEDEDDFFGRASRAQAPKLDANSNPPEDRADTCAECDNLWKRTIIHLDIDCFYCQCEEIDRNLRDIFPPRKIAIGQKHIIVTSNYEARKHGVKKLQLREAAMKACPDLWIIEGSDLEKYRQHSRAIYEAFRSSLLRLADRVSESNRVSVAIRKGSGMDEMLADMGGLVDALLSSKMYPEVKPSLNDVYVLGDDSNAICMSEDQSGAQTFVSSTSLSEWDKDDWNLPLDRRNAHSSPHFPSVARRRCMERLQAAACLAHQVRTDIFDETGFHTTVGVSVSPQLAKLATDIRKPKSTNILPPWLSSNLLYNIPLRKLHTIGHRTIKVLHNELKAYHGQEPPFWKVSHFLALPRQSIVKAVSHIAGSSMTGDQHCESLLLRCRGIDDSPVEDDHGGIQKTVSVEDSFIRGSLTTLAALHQAMDKLLQRLPRLVRDRASWSNDAAKAYPTTIRVTLRSVDPSKLRDPSFKKRRPFVTHSKQSPLDGNQVFAGACLSTHAQLLKSPAYALLQSLLPSNLDDLNVTRLNLAVVNFLDVPTESILKTNPTSFSANFFSQKQQVSPDSIRRKVVDSKEHEMALVVPSTHKSRPAFYSIDPTILKELPRDIADEVKKSYKIVGEPASPKKRRIDDYFRRKT